MLSDLGCKHRAKSVPPEPNCFVAGVDATFVQKNLDIPKGQREPHIVHHRRADDFWAGFEIAKWGAFCHPVRLRNHPARLKPVLSDSAHESYAG